MNSKLIESVADAVLYEGYMLYPYRPSAVKNQQRWNFGVVYPQSHCDLQKGSDSCWMQTQCLVSGAPSTVVQIKVRFLRAVSRQIGKVTAGVAPAGLEPQLQIVETLAVGEKTLQSWQEAIESGVAIPPVRIADILESPRTEAFAFSDSRELEPVLDDSGSTVAFVVRTREIICGSVQLRAEECAEGQFRVTVVISNLTQLEEPATLSREEVLLRSLLSAHTILSVSGGEFVSLIDPPADLQKLASECKNVGTWPVLVGEDRSQDAMLSSPIILYDYPQIAPESPGALFDGTEIDEILALRILTLSEDEKREIRETDARAREILERTEMMPEEHFLKLHGVLRGMKPAAEIGEERAREGER
jgi:hydrogenase maturation protease